LIDAAIFRQAITIHGSGSAPARVAHLFCEQFASLVRGRPLIAQLSRCGRRIARRFVAGSCAFSTGGVLVSRQGLSQFTSTMIFLSGANPANFLGRVRWPRHRSQG
jgi:hypothetical protein